jgi:uncharacterized protein YyaL (SSP411 family)
LIGALAFAGKTLGEEQYLAAARRAAQCTLTTLKPNGELLRRYAKGEAAIAAYLDDYAFLADGLLDLAEATGETTWINEAKQLTDTLLDRFWDGEDGGFFYSGTGHETLIAQSKDFFDGALPAPNGVAARVLALLANLPHWDPIREFCPRDAGKLPRLDGACPAGNTDLDTRGAGGARYGRGFEPARSRHASRGQQRTDPEAR